MSVYRAKSSLFSGLNDAQREAVEHTEGPLLVLAGAGTGKTQVITRRIAYLLERGVSPSAVLAVTFTRKAATEMRERVDMLLGTPLQGLTVSTFHSLGYRILRENGYRLKFGRRIAVYGEQERFRLMDAVLESTQVRLPGGAGTALSWIARAKNDGITATEFLEQARNPFEKCIGEVYLRYQQILREQSCIDLDDMVGLPVALLEHSRHARRTYGNRWQYLLVDEYQDTKSGQAKLARYLSGAQSNLCVVGDDDQSIYRFRGADVRHIRHFAADFPGTVVIRLEENFRSHAEIIGLANAVISQAENRYDKRLIPSLGRYLPATWKMVDTEEEETAFITAAIHRLTGEDADVRLHDIAVLTRVERDVESIALALHERGIPSHRGRREGDDASVVLMTLHQAKGLEFPVVFLPALEDETIPHYHALREGGEAIDEERRLLYVGITRAKRQLFLSSAWSRHQHERQPSRFLADVEGGFLVRH